MPRAALRTYLSDHLAGSRHAVELVDRCLEAYGDDAALRSFLAGFREALEEERGMLRSLLVRMGGRSVVGARGGGWTAERGARLARLATSANGSLRLERLEMLALGIARRAALWDALDAASGSTGRFGGVELDGLRRRAADQRRELERHRLRVARELFVGAGEPDLRAAPAELRGVLLDLDGTLLDSNDAHARAWHQAFREAGHDLAFEEIRPLVGLDGDRFMAELTDVDPDGEEGRALSDRHTELFLEEQLPGCRPTPGARALVERLRDEGLVLCVATSAGEDHARPILEKAGVADLVEMATSAGDVAAGKPDPGLLEAALEKAGLEPGEALLLGDTPFDVEAGLGAGVGVVAVRCGGAGDAELSGALAVYDDPEDLLAGWEGSPLAR